MKTIYILLSFILIGISTQAQDNYWHRIDNQKRDSQNAISETNYTLDVARFTTALNTKNAHIELPLPDGKLAIYDMQPTPVFATSTLEKYPFLQSYTGRDDRRNIVKIALGKEHIYVTGSSEHGDYSIDAWKGTKYTSYYHADYRKKHKNKQDFKCHVEHHEDDNIRARKQVSSDTILREYDIALSCTGEYATYQGGTQEAVLESYNAAITRVNQMYERDLGITFTMIDSIEQFIFLDSLTDPFSNGNLSAMLQENQRLMESTLKDDEYDVGHIFGIRGGGLAYIQSVCQPDKARGGTAVNNPKGDLFHVDYLCHELGHQFGGTHTQNNDCNRDETTSVEVGSGTTIMGYAGVCPPNVQSYSDAMFHSTSILQMGEYAQLIDCHTEAANINHAPILEDVTDIYVPVGSPILLRASARDTDGDTLSYSWEQIDKDMAPMPPIARITYGPAFRNYAPTVAGTRHIPSLDTLIREISSTWEVLCNTSRRYKFRVLVRDNHPLNGATTSDEITVNYHQTSSPFKITSNHASQEYTTGNTMHITWDTGDTESAPFGIDSVRIYTMDTLLQKIQLAVSPNQGSAIVNIPDVLLSHQKIYIEPIHGHFFALSDGYFNIVQQDSPPLTWENIEGTSPSCHGSSDGKITVSAKSGLPPHQYSLNDGSLQNSGVFDSLSQGTYQLTAVDQNGDSIMTVLSLSSPDKLILNTNIDGREVSLSAEGGTPRYTYFANNTALNQAAYTLQNPEEATFFVQDSLGCTSDSTTLRFSRIDSVAYTVTPITCLGEENGSIYIDSIFGGKPPYISDSGELPKIDGLNAGDLTLTITDAYNTHYVLPTISIEEPSQLEVDTLYFTGNFVTLQVAGGIPPYQYKLNDMQWQESNTFQLPDTDDELQFSVKDKNECIILHTASETSDANIYQKLFYPNPTQGRISIPSDIDVIQVLNVLGQPQVMEIDKNANELDLSRLQNGTYYLQITDGRSSNFVTIIKI